LALTTSMVAAAAVAAVPGQASPPGT